MFVLRGHKMTKNRDTIENIERFLSTLRNIFDLLEYKLEKTVEIRGNPFDCGSEYYEGKYFTIYPYSYDEDNIQYYNFKWRDIEISWYKHIGRGVCVNRSEIGREEFLEMTRECVSELLFREEIE